MRIRLDGFGYYLVAGTRASHHGYHPKTYLNGGVEKDILVSVGCATPYEGEGRSIPSWICDS